MGVGGAVDSGGVDGIDAGLPVLDVHEAIVDADVVEVWRALLDTADTAMSAGSGWVGAVLGTADRRASGPRPLTTGSVVPGFHVTEAVAGQRLVLAGRHRFSAYQLIFHVEPAGPGRTKLSAESRAVFPGPGGWLYRTMLMRTGGHVIAVRRLLGAVRRRAEAQASSR